MNESIALEVFRAYGGFAIIFAIFLAIMIWILAHRAASHGTEVSILWGLVKYTKPYNTNLPHPDPSQSSQSIIDGTEWPPIALYIKNNITMKNFTPTIVQLRQTRKLRQLSAFESGKDISKAPLGTYYFVGLHELINLTGKDVLNRFSQAKTLRFQKIKNPLFENLLFEMHSLNDGTCHIIGFASENDAALVSKLSGETIHPIVLSIVLHYKMSSLISIPINRIVLTEYRKIQFSKTNESDVLDIQVK